MFVFLALFLQPLLRKSFERRRYGDLDQHYYNVKDDLLLMWHNAITQWFESSAKSPKKRSIFEYLFEYYFLKSIQYWNNF
jgi:hypothetical protein